MPLNDSNHDYRQIDSTADQHKPIWAHVVPIAIINSSGNGNVADGFQCRDLLSALRKHLDEVYYRFCQSDMYNTDSRELIASVMKKRFGDFVELPLQTISTKRITKERRNGTFERSLEVQPTTEGVLLNLSLLARCRALVSHDFDMTCRFGSESREFPLGQNQSWYRKPLWAWTSDERLFAEAIDIAEGLIAALPIKVRVTLSNLDDCGVQTTLSWKECSTDDSLRLLYHQPMSWPEPVDSEDDINSCFSCNASYVDLVDLKNTQTVATRLNPVIDDNKLPASESKSTPPPPHTVTVTPEGSQLTDLTTLETAAETAFGEEGPISHAAVAGAARALHIDSDGIDMTVLSQLPPNLRSEVRLAMADEAREKKRRARSHGKIWNWLLETNTGTGRSHHERDRPLKPSLLERKEGKRARTISEYFQK